MHDIRETRQTKEGINRLGVHKTATTEERLLSVHSKHSAWSSTQHGHGQALSMVIRQIIPVNVDPYLRMS